MKSKRSDDKMRKAEMVEKRQRREKEKCC